MRTLSACCAAAVLILAACSSTDTASPAGDPDSDKLAQIIERGSCGSRPTRRTRPPCLP